MTKTLDPTKRLWTLERAVPTEADVIDVLSDDFETLWLPELGPGVVMLTRHLARLLQNGGPIRVEPCELAYRLGLPGIKGGNSAFLKTLGRAIRWGMVDVVDEQALVVHHLVRRHGENEKRRQFLRTRWFEAVAS